MMRTFLILPILILLLQTSFLPSNALFGQSKEKEHMEQARDSAYESAQRAKEAAQKAYEAAKEGTQGFGERMSESAGAARDAASSLGEKVVETFEGGAIHGARETAGNLYEGARERAGNIYEEAKEKVQETAESVKEKAARMAEMGRETEEEIREKAYDTYEDIQERAGKAAEKARERAEDFAKETKRKSEGWLKMISNIFWDIIMFIPRTIGNLFAWSWQTSCDVAEDANERAREGAEGIRQKMGEFKKRAGDYAKEAKEKVHEAYEGMQEQAGKAKERVGDAAQRAWEEAGETAEEILERAGHAKERMTDTGGRAADMMGEKVHLAGDYIRGEGEDEDLLERSREMGEKVQAKAGQAKSWFRCQMERIFKTMLTLSLLAFFLVMSFLFLKSPRGQQKVRHTLSNIKEKANQGRKKATAYMPSISERVPGLRRRPAQQKLEAKESKEIPEEKHEGMEGEKKTTFADKLREDPRKQRT